MTATTQDEKSTSEGRAQKLIQCKHRVQPLPSAAFGSITWIPFCSLTSWVTRTSAARLISLNACCRERLELAVIQSIISLSAWLAASSRSASMPMVMRWDGVSARGSVQPRTLRSITSQVHRQEEHTYELQSLIITAYAEFCLKKQ